MNIKFISKILLLIGAVCVLSIGYSFMTQTDATSLEYVDKKNQPDLSEVYSLDVPQNLSFAGELLPLDDIDVYERMDRELLVNTYWQSNGILLIKRSKRYFPIIEPILKANGIPDDFKYLAVAESGLVDIVSPAGATGFWQIMKGTGKEYGLEINSNVDERYHIEKATNVACKYLLKAKDIFGSWTLAAASYNAGISGIRKQMERQKESSYYDMILNDETERYLFRIVALKEILSSPEKYYFNINPKHYYKNVSTTLVEVDTAITDIPDFAKMYGLSYKQFKIHNPWLRDNYLVNKSRKLYKIKIPDDR